MFSSCFIYFIAVYLFGSNLVIRRGNLQNTSAGKEKGGKRKEIFCFFQPIRSDLFPGFFPFTGRLPVFILYGACSIPGPPVG